VITCTSYPWRANSRARKLKRLAPTAGLGANQYEMMSRVRTVQVAARRRVKARST